MADRFKFAGVRQKVIEMIKTDLEAIGIKVTIAEREKKLFFTDSTIEYIKF